jgi:hypothetical protein
MIECQKDSESKFQIKTVIGFFQAKKVSADSGNFACPQRCEELIKY